VSSQNSENPSLPPSFHCLPVPRFREGGREGPFHSIKTCSQVRQTVKQAGRQDWCQARSLLFSSFEGEKGKQADVREREEEKEKKHPLDGWRNGSIDQNRRARNRQTGRQAGARSLSSSFSLIVLFEQIISDDHRSRRCMSLFPSFLSICLSFPPSVSFLPFSHWSVGWMHGGGQLDGWMDGYLCRTGRASFMRPRTLERTVNPPLFTSSTHPRLHALID